MKLAAVAALLAGVEAPAFPADVCIATSEQITAVLAAAGVPAKLALVTGWARGPRPAVLFMHQVTVVDGWIVVDFTARQYAAELPARWIVPIDDYPDILAERTNVALVTVDESRLLAEPDPAELTRERRGGGADAGE